MHLTRSREAPVIFILVGPPKTEIFVVTFVRPE